MTEQALSLPKEHKGRLPVASVWSEILARKWSVLAGRLLLALGAWQGARVLFGPAVVVDQVDPLT